MCAAARFFSGLLTAVLCLASAPVSAQDGEFPTNFPPEISFTESYTDEVKSLTTDGFTEYFARPNKDSKFKAVVKVSAQGIDLSALNGDSEFTFILGGFELSGTLSDDPRYTPGATSIRVPLRAYDEDRDRDVLVGAVVISWTPAAITVTAEAAAPETYFVASQNYLLVEDAIKDVTPLYFQFAGSVLERDVYFTGTATTMTKEVGVGDEATELELSTVKLNGANDTAAPEVAITSPAAGAITDTDLVTVSGTVADTVGVAAVLVQVNGGDYAPAVVVAGGWSLADVPLNLGANVIRAKAQDLDGNEAFAEVVVLRWTPLLVEVVGSGTVTNGFLGSTLREPGASVTIKAKADPGFIFTGWTGAVVSDQTSITFVVTPGMSVTANFTPLPFGTLEGRYSGLILAPTGEPAGPVKIQLSGAGTFTAKVSLGKRKVKIKGAFDSVGRYTGTILRKGLPYVVDLTLDMANGSETISGTVSDGSTTYALNSDHAIYGPENPSPQAGVYSTLFLVPEVTEPRVPTSAGLVNVKVLRNGKVKLTGKLGDGTPFATTSTVLKNGRVPVYFRSKKARTVVGGTLRFNEGGAAGEDLQGVLTWIKGAVAGTAFPEGFRTELTVRGSQADFTREQ